MLFIEELGWDAVTQANESGATPMKTAGLFALALVLLVCFLLIEWRSKAPLMPLDILRSRTLRAACAASLTLFGSFQSFLFICTLYLQAVLRYFPVNASLALLPASVVSIPIGLFVAPWLMNRVGMRLSAGLGLLCVMSGIALFLRIGANDDYVGIILPGVVIAMSGGATTATALSVAAVSGIEPTRQGLPAGLQGMSGLAGGGLGLAITAAQGMAPTSAPSVAAQLSGFHAGLLVAAAGAALGVLLFESLVALLIPRKLSHTEGTKRCDFCDSRRIF